MPVTYDEIFLDWLFRWTPQKKKKHFHWRTTEGYILEYRPHHHFSRRNRYILRHRLVWEQANKASLLPWTVIYHLNGIKDDNRIENLEPRIVRKRQEVPTVKNRGRVIRSQLRKHFPDYFNH